MNVTPQWNVEIDGVYFKNRELFEVDDDTVNLDGAFGLQDYYNYELDGTTIYLPTSIFMEIPDSEKLDSRSMRDKMYDDNKQRDTNFIKVYKERMGIHVFNSYAEEDYHRHKDNSQSSDVGLPEGHSISDEE